MKALHISVLHIYRLLLVVMVEARQPPSFKVMTMGCRGRAGAMVLGQTHPLHPIGKCFVVRHIMRRATN